MFRAPFGATVLQPNASFVRQLLSPESINRAGYFDAEQVALEVKRLNVKRRSHLRSFDEMALVTVFATQLWHNTFIDDSLCDLPSYSSPARQTTRIEHMIRVT